MWKPCPSGHGRTVGAAPVAAAIDAATWTATDSLPNRATPWQGPQRRGRW